MGILDTLRKDNNEVENTVEETQTSDVSETPAQEENPQEPVEETQTVVVDRPAYNCPDCHGQGLTANQTARCATCSGTGKVN